ncbi:MAG: serine/threonine-protein kinase, partial [Thermoanaerobaculia bacterium]
MPAISTVGHYRILSPLGAGGMGEVYLATDTRLNRNVAIKVLPASSAADDEAQRRMLREARMVATIDHPNVCTIYDIGEDAQRPYIVMQYIQGETLSERMRRGRLDLAETIGIARQITLALAEAHSRGVVHRDIKPGNIMISSAGVVKVLDFGLAKSFAQESSATELMISTPGLIAGTTS